MYRFDHRFLDRHWATLVDNARLQWSVETEFILPMGLPSDDSPGILELARLIDQNFQERKDLIDKEWQLRTELQMIVQRKMSSQKFEEVRAREREARAALSRNFDQYDVLVEKWAAEASRIEPSSHARSHNGQSTNNRTEVQNDSRSGLFEHVREPLRPVEKIAPHDTASIAESLSIGDQPRQKVAVPPSAMVRNAGFDLVPKAPTSVNAAVQPSGPSEMSSTFGSRLPEAPKPVFDYPLESE
jgi:hypothetical protein